MRSCDDGTWTISLGTGLELETLRKTQDLSRMTKAVNLSTGSALAHIISIFAFAERTIIHVCAFNVNGAHLTINCRAAITR